MSYRTRQLWLGDHATQFKRTDMVREHIPWNQGSIAALLCAVLLGTTPPAKGQADAWVLANANGNAGNWVDLSLNVAQVGAVLALPTPGGADGYAGQIPTRSHHIRTNGEGALIFFAVDGNLYDGDGYLIADARGSSCSECLAPGVMEFLSVPVPGKCGLYYLLSSEPKSDTYNATHIQVALLDMEQPRDPGSTDECQRKGRLIDLFDDSDLPASHPDLVDWASDPFSLLNETAGPTPFNGSSTDYMGKLPLNTMGKSKAPQFRIVEGTELGDDHFLFVKLTTTLHIYRMASTGIFLVQPLSDTQFPPNGLDLMPLQAQFNQDPSNFGVEYSRDFDARRIPSGDIRVAMTGFAGFSEWPDPDAGNNLLTILFNGSTGSFISGSNQALSILPAPLGPCNAPDNSAGGLAGCSIAADGNRIFLTLETTTNCTDWTPRFGYVDVAADQFVDLTSSVALPANYVRTRIYRNRAPIGTSDALYIPTASGVGVVTVLNSSSPTFSTGAITNGIPPQIAVSVSGAGTYRPHFLAIAVSGDQHLSTSNKEQCCGYFETVPGAAVEGYTQAAGTSSTWNGPQNGVQPSSSAAVFICDLVVETGASLFISNMDLKFANNAKVVVRRGGYLKFNNCSLSSLECPDQRWPGIRVEGDPLNSSQSSGVQGIVHLNSTVVSNAVVGVWCARELNPTTPVAGFFGGRLIASQSTFSNCITGVRITNYHRYSGGMELPNLSLISQTTFETTSSSPDGATPGKHIELLDVNGVVRRTGFAEVGHRG